MRTGADFMEISVPPPAGVSPAAPPRPSSTQAVSGPMPTPPSAPPAIARTPAPAGPGARPLGGGGAMIARAPSGGGGSGGSANDAVVEAVLRAMREENEHLGILDGIDPLF